MLRQLPVDFVKIDRSVVVAALVDESAAAVLSGIVAFARRAQKFVIAEGIETQSMLDTILQTSEGGVQAVQGFLFGRPSETTFPSSPDVVLPLHRFRAHRRDAPPIQESDRRGA
jgi:EAL domain-containing protein (putative c-di-GMP-specific phosphodiesterase class I)